jgi:hypothetical protein
MSSNVESRTGEGSTGSEIFVNKKKIQVAEATLTGSEILTRAAFDPSQYDLFLVEGQKNEKIDPSQSVEIRNGLHFNAILRTVPYGGTIDP